MQSSSKHRFLRCAAGMLIALALVVTASGCASGASLQFADLNFKRLNPDDPLIVNVPIESCWWSIEGQQVHIAMTLGDIRSESGTTRERMLLSLVLEGIPEGQAREYRLGKPAMRCYRHEKQDHARYASLQGVATIRLRPGNMLEGRFRISARKQVFHILTNWTTVGPTLVMGTFTAKRDGERVSSILVQTEEGGMERQEKANSITTGRPLPRQVVGPDVEE